MLHLLTVLPKHHFATYLRVDDMSDCTDQVNNVLPFKVDCAVCGADCVVTIPIIKKKITIKGQPCRVKAGTLSGTTVLAIPAKDPVPLKVTFSGSGTIQDSKGTVVVSVSASGEVTPS